MPEIRFWFQWPAAPIVNGSGGANKAIRTSGSDIFERLGLREAWSLREAWIGKVRNGLFLQIVRKAQPFGRIGV
jgi:hypothetical protein